MNCIFEVLSFYKTIIIYTPTFTTTFTTKQIPLRIDSIYSFTFRTHIKQSLYMFSFIFTLEFYFIFSLPFVFVMIYAIFYLLIYFFFRHFFYLFFFKKHFIIQENFPFSIVLSPTGLF